MSSQVCAHPICIGHFVPAVAIVKGSKGELPACLDHVAEAESLGYTVKPFGLLDIVVGVVDAMDLDIPPGASWGIDQEGVWVQLLSGNKLRDHDAQKVLDSWKRSQDGQEQSQA